MAHGGYAPRRAVEGRPPGRRSKGLGVDKRKKKQKVASLKNQIRSVERLLRKNLPAEMKAAQEQKLEELKRQQEIQTRLAIERKIQLRDRKIKFFERRKIERMIRRLEKQQRSSSDHASEEKISDQLSKLKEDLEYVKFFPKIEKYVSLFVGGDNPEILEKRNKLRKQIKANLVAAAASGKDLEETASDDDALDMSDDDFFANCSTDEAEADDEWTDKSTREPASSASGKAASGMSSDEKNQVFLSGKATSSSASGKATSGMSSDEKNQRQISARALMPPPRSLPTNRTRSLGKHTTFSNASHSRNGSSSRSWGSAKRDNNSNLSSNSDTHISNASHSRNGSSSRSWGSAKRDNNSNLSSNSDTHKPRRKRRPKKKKQA